jgi:hypothetical protein
LLRLDPGEVLINFMTGHILRFVDSPDEPTQASFAGLFGSNSYQAQFRGLKGQDREDAIVRAYCDVVQRTGGYQYVCSTVVLRPEKDSTHFNLIYATRNSKGLEVFKEVEKTAMKVMEAARSDAQRRHREQSSQQRELFDNDVLYDSTRYVELRDRYLTLAKTALQQAISQQKSLAYDDAWVIALLFPLVWESDLKDWIRDWEAEGTIVVLGKQLRQRVCRRNSGQALKWLGG